MTRRFGGLLAVVVAAATVLVGGGGAGASAAGSAALPTGVRSGQSPLTADVAHMVRGTGVAAQQRALAQYWSAARMRQALPDSQLPSVKQATANVQQRLAKSATRPGGPPGKIAPSTPRSAVTTPKAVPQSYYPNYPIGHPVARTYGKVFFTAKPDQNPAVNYVCSGTVVNTEGRSTVWTAGHCVSDGGSWNYNWVFVPNYVNGSAPYGKWNSCRLSTTTAWFNNNNDFANDLGGATMCRLNGSRIQDVLGGQGFAWNQSVSYAAYSFGYPQASPFNGAYLVGCYGTTFDNGGSTIGLYCDMTGGSSGGAWLRWFDGNWGYINGHNDFKYNNNPYCIYSPYYGNNAGSLYNFVRNIST
jgi:hypothetical protein